MLKKRSDLLRQVRAFFYTRDVIEVDTPQLSMAATPDLHLHSLSTQVLLPGSSKSRTYYLHTSPEYPMKRLLCSGSGDIFYLGKVFRDGDMSSRHQIEFTMLEWYRLGFSMQALIDEVAELINRVLPESRAVQQMTYQQAFQNLAGIEDIFSADSQELIDCLERHHIAGIVGVEKEDKPLWQQLVLTDVIEPQLGQDVITVLTHFPAEQASLAQISPEDQGVAERFEIFVNGIELANGYHELTDAKLYRQRFNESLAERQQYDLPAVPLDENLLNTLETSPLPDCSGVALGFDRLFMMQQGLNEIEEVVAFSTEKA